MALKLSADRKKIDYPTRYYVTMTGDVSLRLFLKEQISQSFEKKQSWWSAVRDFAVCSVVLEFKIACEQLFLQNLKHHGDARTAIMTPTCIGIFGAQFLLHRSFLGK